ncbi:MAG: RNA polymerase factor sigma-54 [Hyphomicrobiaceae bacterium]
MALTTKLELRQGQSLVMTPQLQQAIKLLQLSNLELSAFVEAELERNPLLEREDSEGPTASDAERPEPADKDQDGLVSLEHGDGGEDWDSTPVTREDAGAGADLDHGPEEGQRADDDPHGASCSPWSSSASSSSHGGGDEDYNLEEFVAGELSLADHLKTQLACAIPDQAERLIGLALIDMVDEAGYVRGDLDGLAERLGTSLGAVERVLAVMQAFEPAGVMARNLAECLVLQLKDRNRYDPIIAKLIDNLDLLAGHNLPALRRICGCDAEELADMIGEIRALNPKPGLAFGPVQVQTVVPDVIVRPRSDGGWSIELNSDTLPKVLVNQTYLTSVSKIAASPKDKTYLQDCLQTANWLVRSLDQRARTILKVAEEIVRQQDAFLSYGIQHLRPLNLKTVADAIGMHESTVSRVTSNKYMATNRGIFELKFFFTSAIASAGDGEAHSSESVRHRIRQLIDAETADDILSDDRIVAKLKDEGVDIARRTVAKYREAMHIASSVQRRRSKRMDVSARVVA